MPEDLYPIHGANNNSSLIDVEELASLLGISVRSVWRQCAAGKVPPPVRIGGSTRWRADVIRRWIENDCRGTTTRR